MSPPEVWGPAVWTLFHTFAEKINDEAYPYVTHSLFKMIVRICKFLPCPECSNDASNFLAKIKMTDMKNKTDFRNTFYLFHNYVNAKKRKRLFNSANMHIYGKYRLIDVVNNFISKYHTKGNMKLLTESFQRQLVIKEFKNWFSSYIKAFIPRVNIPARIPSEAIETKSEEVPETKTDEVIEATVSEEKESIVAEEKVYLNENIVSEEIVSQETTDISEKSETVEVCEEKEPDVEENGRLNANEEIVEDITIVQNTTTKKRGRKAKNK